MTFKRGLDSPPAGSPTLSRGLVRHAILVDGAFARRKLGSPGNPAGIAQFQNLFGQIAASPQLNGSRLHRIYYYDANPLKGFQQTPLQGPQINFGIQPIAVQSQALFQSLQNEPYLALRIGETSFNGWTVKQPILAGNGNQANVAANDLKPVITQKGVDMRIGLDIAALTLKKQVDIIVLVTGDSDFVPAMKFARREGVQLLLMRLGHNVKPSMLEHCDDEL